MDRVVVALPTFGHGAEEGVSDLIVGECGSRSGEICTERVEELEVGGEDIHWHASRAFDMKECREVADSGGIVVIRLNERAVDAHGLSVLNDLGERGAGCFEVRAGSGCEESTKEPVMLTVQGPGVNRVEVEELVDVDEDLGGKDIRILEAREVVAAHGSAIVRSLDIMMGFGWVKGKIFEEDREVVLFGHVCSKMRTSGA